MKKERKFTSDEIKKLEGSLDFNRWSKTINGVKYDRLYLRHELSPEISHHNNRNFIDLVNNEINAWNASWMEKIEDAINDILEPYVSHSTEHASVGFEMFFKEIEG